MYANFFWTQKDCWPAGWLVGWLAGWLDPSENNTTLSPSEAKIIDFFIYSYNLEIYQ